MVRQTLFLLSIIFFSNCGPNYEVNQSQSIANERWTYQDSVRFSMDIQDTTKLYNLFFEIEHVNTFAYQNLYTKIYTIFPDGQRFGKVVSMELANKAGQWLGKCSGNNCTLSIPIQESAYFDKLGTHYFVMEQYMRQPTIGGIRKLSFKAIDTGERK